MIKKIFTTLLLLSYILHESLAQDITSSFYESSYPTVLENSVKPPVIPTLFSYKEFPVQYSTGQVSIQIPIYNLNINSLSFPFNLSYNSSGIKIQDNSGIVGFGWSLNNGFKISRSIRGKDDLEFPVEQANVIDLLDANSQGNDYITKLVRIASEDSYNLPDKYESFKRDGQYDIFRIELPGMNAAFILEYKDGEYKAITFKPLPISIKLLITQKDISNDKKKSRCYYDLYGIEVKDDNGIIYHFGEEESRNSQDQNKYTEYNKYTSNSGLLKNSWMLRAITLTPGNVIRFNYKDGLDYPDFKPTIRTSVLHRNFSIQNELAATQNDYLILIGSPKARSRDGDHVEYNSNLVEINALNRGTEDYQNKPEPIRSKLIKNIISRGINLEFNYDSVLKIGDPKSPEETSFYRQRLSNLKVYSIMNNNMLENIKEIHFHGHDGFLDSLTVSGSGKYKFSYDRRDKEFSSYQFERAIDWWGYCNGKDNSSSLPFSDTGIELGERRSPDSLYTKIRSLEEITYPTGGVVNIVYETHVLQDGSYGAGLRVKSLQTFDPSSGKKIIKKFKYENPRYSGIPYGILDYLSYVRTHLYAGKDIAIILQEKVVREYHTFAYEVDIDACSVTTFPITDKPYTSFHVWYEKVTEENDEGKIEYKFDYTPFDTYFIYWNSARNNTMCNEEPSLVEQKCFKKKDTGDFELIKSIKNEYTFDYLSKHEVKITNSYREKSTYGGIRRTGGYSDLAAMDPQLWPGRSPSAWAFGQVSLQSTIEKAYFQNDSIETRTIFQYDKDRPYNLISKTTFINNSDCINQKYYYSNHILPFNKGVINTDHGLIDCDINKTSVIQEVTQRNNQLVGSKLTYFRTVNINHKTPKEVYYSGPDNIMEKRMEYLSCDVYGNPVEMVKDKYSFMVRLWSYCGTHPVIEIKNATYAQVKNALGAPFVITLPREMILSEEDWVKLNNLRLSPDMKNASITTYKYKPLVGVIEMVDPRGITTYYDYDEYGRLKEIYILENGKKKLLQENEYKFYNDKNE